MRVYDEETEFDGEFAAKLIAGANDNTTLNQDRFRIVKKRLETDYQQALKHYQAIDNIDLDAVLDKWVSRPPLPSGAVQSTDMQRCERLLEGDPNGGTFSGWLSWGRTEFEHQIFDRTELQRWLDVRGIVSAYRFDCVKSENAASMPVVTPEPQAAPVGAVGFIQDPERRLAALRALGGTDKYKNHEWHFTGITKLVESEKGRPRSDVKTIRSDLKEAAQAERDAKSAVYVDGLGQR